MTETLRTFRLDGEIASRAWGRVSPPVMLAWLVTLVVAVVLFFTLGMGVVSVFTAGGLLLVVFAATLELGDRKSWAAVRTHEVRKWIRTKGRWNVFIAEGHEHYGNPKVDPGWPRPTPVGDCVPLDLAGTGLDDLFVLHHKNPGEGRGYFSVVIRVEGVASGLRGDSSYSASSESFGGFLAELARKSSHIRSVQMVHRSVGHDMSPRWRYFQRCLEAWPGPDPRLGKALDSFRSLLFLLTPNAQEHQSFVVLRFPATKALMAEAARSARAKGHSKAMPGGVAQVIRNETDRAVNLLVDAGMGRVEVLGERAVCAAIRGFLDPSHPLNRVKGASWGSCFPSYKGERDSMLVEGIGPEGEVTRWRTRVGVVPARAYKPQELTPLWMVQLLTGVRPDPGDMDVIPPTPTDRTICVHIDLVEQSKAAEAAKLDYTKDSASVVKAQQEGRITSGESETMRSAAARRHSDLMAGSGHHGAIFSVSVAVTAADEERVLMACTRVEEAASSSGLSEIEWQTDAHDAAVFQTTLLGRGPARTKWSR